MVRKKRFPPEEDTRPDLKRPKDPVTHQSGPAPKDVRERAEAPTIPPPSAPPPTKRSGRPAGKTGRGRVSDVREVDHGPGAATVDEVTADLSKDPRRERDDEE
jgi:hypothetical protein